MKTWHYHMKKFKVAVVCRFIKYSTLCQSKQRRQIDGSMGVYTFTNHQAFKIIFMKYLLQY